MRRGGDLAKECGRKSANKYRKLKREVAIMVVYVYVDVCDQEALFNVKK
jgi:hypothetical protein